MTQKKYNNMPVLDVNNEELLEGVIMEALLPRPKYIKNIVGWIRRRYIVPIDMDDQHLTRRVYVCLQKLIDQGYVEIVDRSRSNLLYGVRQDGRMVVGDKIRPQ